MSRFLFRASLVLAALIALFVSAMNQELVAIELAFLKVRSSLGLALVVAFVVGLLAGLFWRIAWVAELLSERGKLRRALRAAETRMRTEAAAKDADMAPGIRSKG
jgi:uncharacterized integral membrane protein